MQINNKIKWSILIWAIFLSIILSISFISISWKINKSIKNKENIGESNNLDIVFKNNNFSDRELWNNEEIIFDNNKSYLKTLKINENTEVRIKNHNKDISLSLKINYWWPIYYNFLSFSWITSTWTINSWIIENNLTFTWNLSNSYNNGILYIKNLWWDTNFDLQSSEILTTQYKNYKIMKQIWNKKFIKNEWTIKIFDLWNFNWINYKKYWFYF